VRAGGASSGAGVRFKHEFTINNTFIDSSMRAHFKKRVVVLFNFDLFVIPKRHMLKKTSIWFVNFLRSCCGKFPECSVYGFRLDIW
jgi:hypothetical protein